MDMQKISTLAINQQQAMVATTANHATASKQQASAEKGAAYIDRLFERLLDIYPSTGAAWRNEVDLLADKKEWTKVLYQSCCMDAGLIKRGLANCKQAANDGEKWLPSAHLFVARCKTVDPVSVGMPTVDAAFSEACKQYPNKWHNWSHKAVYWAATGISPYDYSSNKEKWLRDEFSRLYTAQVARVANGEVLADAALPAKPDKPVKAAAPSGFFSDLRALLG